MTQCGFVFIEQGGGSDKMLVLGCDRDVIFLAIEANADSGIPKRVDP